MGSLFINAYQETDTNFLVDIETAIVLTIYELVDTKNVELHINKMKKRPTEPLIFGDFTNIKYKNLLKIPNITYSCIWPVIVSGKNIIAGLCSVSRELIKKSDDTDIRKLLGFRDASLMACSECSIWTRFCEVDIIKTTKKLIQNDYNKPEVFSLPEDVARFEFHLSKPVRMHNIYKAAREKNKNKSINSKIPINELNLDHIYGEGTMMTLADVILYPCFKVLFTKCPKAILQDKIPLTIKWFENMEEHNLLDFKFNLPDIKHGIVDVIQPHFVKQSLYTSDPSRYKPEKRIYTKQQDIEEAFKAVSLLEKEIVNDILPFGHEVPFDWFTIPLEANPTGGALPQKRANRKCEQLENLTKAVVKLAGINSYKIVDFCSGSGHLGILLAVLLPKCHIILVENKEYSLERARERIKNLKLQNVSIVQSNLDYFIGNFDIGMALHACGVATDLVMQHCINNSAHFVLCPCCYGGVKNCHHIKYPRSRRFQKLEVDYKNYLNLAHAADQTHDVDNVKTKQGFLCMDIVDTDRKMYAECCGYEVHLGKLQPASCTNKNNLLVGFYKEKT